MGSFGKVLRHGFVGFGAWLALHRSYWSTVDVAYRRRYGQIQYLCRRYSVLVDLFIRGFLLASFRRHFDRRVAPLKMRADTHELGVICDPPLVSGCVMLFRTETLKRLNGFDPCFFLYFAVYNRTLRARVFERITYVPGARRASRRRGCAQGLLALPHVQFLCVQVLQSV